MAREFVPEAFIGKPARIGWSTIAPQLGKDDGHGRASVNFYLEFGLQESNGKYITAKGKLRYAIRIYQPAYYRNDPRMVMLGSPEYREGEADVKKLLGDQAVDIASFREGDSIHQGLIYTNIITPPIKLKIDVAEWRYIYEIWFKSSWWQELYYGHTSQYYRFDFRFNEKEVQEIRSLVDESVIAMIFLDVDKAAVEEFKAPFSDERLKGMSSTERQQLLEKLRDIHKRSMEKAHSKKMKQAK